MQQYDIQKEGCTNKAGDDDYGSDEINDNT